MVRNGATCFLKGCGSVLEPDAAAAAIEAVGMRGSLGDPYIWDIGGEWAAPFAKRIPPDLGRALDLLGGQLKRNRDEEALVRGHVAMTGHATASDELELAAKACADEHGAILNQHQSYAASDTSADDELRGQHPLAHFGEIGVLGENCAFAHMNLIRDDEVEPVTASGLWIAWCPTASMLWGRAEPSGAPCRALQARCQRRARLRRLLFRGQPRRRRAGVPGGPHRARALGRDRCAARGGRACHGDGQWCPSVGDGRRGRPA